MENVVASFWKNKKVFLTGHTGFKGSWLSLWLTKMGADVTGYSLAPPTNPSLFELAKIRDCVHSIEGDVRDFCKLQAELKKADPEIIIHMAAQPLVRASYNNPLDTYSTNVMGTAHIHEAAKALNNLKALINVTTDKCYENKEHLTGYKEEEPLGGHDPYSNSKACSELVSSAYRQSFKMPIATARAGNVIGGGDWAADRLLPDIFRALLEKREIIIRNPSSIRPWQHVLEPLSGYLILAQHVYNDSAKFSSAFNFGPPDSDTQTVEQIVKQLISLWGEGASYKIANEDGPHEAKLLTLDCGKAKKFLHWAPKWELKQSLPRVSDWYKKVGRDPSLAKELTLNEISLYEAAPHRST